MICMVWLICDWICFRIFIFGFREEKEKKEIVMKMSINMLNVPTTVDIMIS